MPTPRLPSFGADGSGFFRWMKGIDSKIALIMERLNNVLANTGLSVPGPGVVECDGIFNVVGTQNVSGDLNVTGATTIGGPTTISGLTTVSGTNGIESSNYVSGTSGWKFDGTSLEANTGVIGNGALANPLSPTRVHSDANTFTVTVAWATIATATATVPAGYSQALILSMAVGATANNSTAASDFLYARGRVNTGPLGGYSLGSADVPPGKYGLTFDFQTGLLTGLTAGSTLTFTAQVSSAFGSWAANSGNVANLDVALLWLR
jgi:hypothetical protein